jgi:hypothetical protein
LILPAAIMISSSHSAAAYTLCIAEM